MWAHVPVLVNEQRKKLSKRRDKVAVEQYRAEGYLAEAMVNYLMTLGWSPPGDREIVPWSVIEQRVSARGRQPLAGVLRHQEARRVQRRVHPHAVDRRVHRRLRSRSSRPTVPWPAERFDAASSRRWRRSCSRAPARSPRCPAWSTSSSSPTRVLDEQAWAQTMPPPRRVKCWREVTQAYRELPHWDAASLKEALEAVGDQHGLKKGKAQAPIRVAITGRTVGPPLFEALEVLGRDEVLRRLTMVCRGVSELDPLLSVTPPHGTAVVDAPARSDAGGRNADPSGALGRRLRSPASRSCCC